MSREALRILDEEIDRAVSRIRGQAEGWPCQSGCANCCKSLGAPMLASPEEWRRLEAGIDALPAPARAQIRAGFDAMDGLALRGARIACPVLDEEDRCRAYLHRPLRCRAHGYFAGREGGYWCDEVEARVAGGGAEGVIFGRHEALEIDTTRALGAAISWREWRDAREGHTHPPSC